MTFHFAPEVRTDTRDPGMCAYHHVLIGGRMQVEFVHCSCPASTGNIGHYAWICRDCEDEGRGGEAWLYPAGHHPKYETHTRLYPQNPLAGTQEP